MEFVFGNCELSTERMELRRDGGLVAVEPQVFEVLAHLVAHRDRVVTKVELLDAVWGDRFVSDSALTSRIKTARRLIGDTGRDQRIIKTVHGRGYRFVAEVSPAAPAGQTPPDRGDQAGGRLAAVVGAVAAGTGAAVDVHGGRAAAGDVLDRLADEALAQELAVGRARGGSPAGRVSCVVEALDEVVQRCPDLLDGLPRPVRAELERLFAGGVPTTRQRLFVAVRELVVAASRPGVVLLLDEVTLLDPDDALLVEVARLASRFPVAVVVSQRHPRLLRGFEVVRLAEEPGTPADGLDLAASLDPAVLDVLARAALVGPQVDRMVVRAAARGDEELAGGAVQEALAAGVLTEVHPGHLHFADDGVHETILDRLAPAHRAGAGAELALELDRAGAAPERVATVLLEAGRRGEAVPFALAAARTAAAGHLHGEVQRWADAVRDGAGGEEAAELLALRADALAATGAATAVAAYRAALAAAAPATAPGLRARLARTALLSGDLGSAEEALDGLEPDGGPYDGAILLARGMLAYFRGDLDGAEAAVRSARSIALAPGAPAQLLDVITLQGMIAHNRGQWFDRLRRELRATSENPALATAVFDSHLCVAEYLLYGPTAYDEIRRLTDDLRAQAEAMGARRGVAFAVTVAGEGALLAGDLDTARRDLEQAIELHREMGADTGTAHAMQRLAEVELAGGDRAAAERLARRALPLARWSPLARHLLQRIFGTLIAAAPDVDAALAAVEEAELVLDEPDCVFCRVMFEVPAAVACAEAGRLDDARRHLAVADLSAAMWQGTSWQAATTEAKAHLARAEGRAQDAVDLLAEAASLFGAAGQPLDAERCLEARAALESSG